MLTWDVISKNYPALKNPKQNTYLLYKKKNHYSTLAALIYFRRGEGLRGERGEGRDFIWKNQKDRKLAGIMELIPPICACKYFTELYMQIGWLLIFAKIEQR